MAKRWALIALVTLAATLAACGSGSDDESPAAQEATLAACEADLLTLEVTTQAARAYADSPPRTMDDLSDAGLPTHGLGTYYTLTAGEVTLTDKGRETGCPQP